MKTIPLTAMILLLSALASAQQPEPKVCDLDVLYIQRTPRYPAYLPQYDLPGHEGEPLLTKTGPDGKPTPLKPGEADPVQHWPKVGDKVTYTAVVENKGTADATPFEYAWYVDGKEVAAGKTTKNLPPGQRIELTLKRAWKMERAKVEFWADPMRRVRQFSFANDRCTRWTHAKALVCYADSLTYASFAKNRNFLGTYSFEDWCQEHVDWMNLLFERSVYPGAPDGILDRVAVDFIGTAKDEEAHKKLFEVSSLAQGWDGGWWFGRSEDCSQWAAGMDWGLIHEWGHQLGLTDLYALDVAPEGNLILDKTGSPILLGSLSFFAGTMMHGHGPVLFAEDQAIALNHQLWRRRGYFGDYYYNLADKNYVLVTDGAGKPLAGAKLAFWQRNLDNVFEGRPTFTGQTGKDGKFLLPNRDAPKVVTYGDAGGGYTLKPNPFGAINVVGVNGRMFVQIDARGQTDYSFLEIPQFNVAKGRAGSKSDTVVVTIPTQLPLEGAAAAPPPPVVQTSGNQVKLALAGMNNWVVLRADPGQYLWKEIAQANGATYTDTMPHTGLFRYAAATRKDGKLSARSEPVGVVSMVEPWGLTLGPDGTRYVRDRANGQTLVIRPNGSAVGFVGSVHWHLEGSYDHSADAKGLIYVAKWPDGYDPKHSYIRRIDPKGKGREYDRKDVAGGEVDDAKGHFKEPMGVWVSPKDGAIVVADTGNNRVQIIRGQSVEVIGGFNKPHKAIMVEGNVVVCDTGAKRVAVFAKKDGDWKEIASIAGFEEPAYCCIGASGHVWVADRGLGRVLAIDPAKWHKTDWQFPAKDKAKIADLRGIAYDAKAGELLYLDGKEKCLVTRHMID